VGLRTEDIAYCYASHKIVFIIDNKAQRFILDKSLNDLEKELDPAHFFPNQPEISGQYASYSTHKNICKK